MKFFAQLIDNIGHAHGTKQTIRHLTGYFQSNALPKDKDQAINLLLGRSPARVLSNNKLKKMAVELSGFPKWLIDRSVAEAGDFNKTLAHLLRPEDRGNSHLSISSLILQIDKLKGSPEENIIKYISDILSHTDLPQLIVLLKLLTGTFKSPVSRNEMIRALSEVTGISFEIAVLRLYELEMADMVTLQNFERPIKDEIKLVPYAIKPVEVLDQQIETLGVCDEWKAFGTSSGIRAQLIKYGHRTHLWTDEGEIISDKFPEVITAAQKIQVHAVLDGQLVALNPHSGDQIVSRIHKNHISKKDLEENSARFEIWDTMSKGQPIPDELCDFLDKGSVFYEPTNLNFSNWGQLKTIHKSCRSHGFSGLLLSPVDKQGQYVIWKAHNYSICAALMYVEIGNMAATGIESMTFGLKNDQGLVPIAKINADDCGIDLHEMLEYASKHTLERFGPVRTVAPDLIYELHFDEVVKAARRKSGLMLSGVKISKRIPGEMDNLDTLKNLTNIH